MFAYLLYLSDQKLFIVNDDIPHPCQLLVECSKPVTVLLALSLDYAMGFLPLTEIEAISIFVVLVESILDDLVVCGVQPLAAEFEVSLAVVVGVQVDFA